MAKMRTLQKGNRGEDVKTLQRILHLYVDGIFGKLTEEAVKTFQSEHGLTPDGVVGKATWSVLLSVGDELKKSRRPINEIIVHCTATPEGKNYTVADITAMHKKNGWSTIGYHYLIDINGKINNGRDVNVIGAHCLDHNSYSIGVCYVGGLDKDGKAKDTRTDAQKLSLTNLLTRLRVMYPNAKISGHRDFPDVKKDCPCFNAKDEYKNI